MNLVNVYIYIYLFYLFTNLFARKNITYKFAIQLTLKVLTKRITEG